MAEIDKSRSLEFDRRSSGLGIKIPITAAAAEWSAAVNQLAYEQHVDVRVTRDGEHLLLCLAPGTSREELVRRLNLVHDLVEQADRMEQADLDATAPLEAAALDWWRQR
jgi:hypothetical protein